MQREAAEHACGDAGYSLMVCSISNDQRRHLDEHPRCALADSGISALTPPVDAIRRPFIDRLPARIGAVEAPPKVYLLSAMLNARGSMEAVA